MPEDIVVPIVGFIGLLGLLYVININAYDTNQLKFHRHEDDGRSLPRILEGEVFHPLDGIRGWY